MRFSPLKGLLPPFGQILKGARFKYKPEFRAHAHRPVILCVDSDVCRSHFSKVERRTISIDASTHRKKNMNTQIAVNLFLESRRSKRFSSVTMDTYGWALAKMAEMYPAELPDKASDIQRLFIVNAELSASSLRNIWEMLRIFWSWAENGGICPNVMEGVPAPVMGQAAPHTPACGVYAGYWVTWRWSATTRYWRRFWTPASESANSRP